LITNFYDLFQIDLEKISNNYDVKSYLEDYDTFEPTSKKFLIDITKFKEKTLLDQKHETIKNPLTALLSPATLKAFSRVNRMQNQLLVEIEKLSQKYFTGVSYNGIQIKSSATGMANHTEKSAVGVVYIPKQITNQFMKSKVVLTLDHKKMLKSIGNDVENLLTNN
jgi:hypothetical protein